MLKMLQWIHEKNRQINTQRASQYYFTPLNSRKKNRKNLSNQNVVCAENASIDSLKD